MEIKGRVKAISQPVEKLKKDGSATYTIMEVDVQIGTYESRSYNWSTHQEEIISKADMVRKTYFGEDIAPTQQLLSVGDVVTVRMHHYINQYGRVESVIDSIMPANAKAVAEQKAQQVQQQLAQAQSGSDLPF